MSWTILKSNTWRVSNYLLNTLMYATVGSRESKPPYFTYLPYTNGSRFPGVSRNIAFPGILTRRDADGWLETLNHVALVTSYRADYHVLV